MNKISRTLKKMFGKKVYVDISTTQSGNLLRDKCVVITGGSEGIGAAIARKCCLLYTSPSPRDTR